MGKVKNEGRICPKCGSTENQMNNGFTGAGSQRCLCWHCKHRYTPKPKKWKYSEEERKQALRLLTDGSTGRAVGRAMDMAKSNVYRWAQEESKKGNCRCG